MSHEPIDSALWTGRQPREKKIFVSWKMEISEPRGLWFWDDSTTPFTVNITGMWMT